jgi:hypothetical protein
VNSLAARILAATLVVYIVLDILLTPVAPFETRPLEHVMGVGFATLGLLFVGLALAVLSLVLLFRGSRRAAIVAIVSGVLYFPAVLAEQTGHFSSIQAPTAIERIELVQVVVALIVIGVGAWAIRRGVAATDT